LLKGLNALGRSLTAENFAGIAQDQLVQWEITKQGVGISIMSEDVGDLEPRVQRALPGLPPVPIPLWLTTHRELSTSRRMRVVFVVLFESLAA
jgi:DNA-binding transcriptional LysR family regulator